MPKLILRAEVQRLVPKLFRAEVTRAEHRLPHQLNIFNKNFHISFTEFMTVFIQI